MIAIHLLITLLLFVSKANGSPFDDEHYGHVHRSGCGTPDLSADEFKNLQIRSERYNTNHRFRADKKLCIGCVKINVIFHVIEDSLQESETSRYATDDNIAFQMDVLNKHFSQTPFRFSRIKTTRMVNDDWVYGDLYYTNGEFTFLSNTITASLREGGPDIANIFIVDGGQNGCVANFASLPYMQDIFPVGTYTKADSIFLCAVSLARRDIEAPYEESTLTHETGHWLGLLHTFTGNSCLQSNLNDLVSDTPQQAGPTGLGCYECCTNKLDTCPKLPGRDPVKNYMDYTPCSSEFTPGQVQRMYDEFNEFRRRVEPCSTGEADVQLEFRSGTYPEDTSLEYISWGLKDYFSQSLINIESHIDFANKVMIKKFCIPRQAVYEFIITDQYFLKNPAYFTIRMNKRTLVRLQNMATSSVSTFVSGDSASCSMLESRFQLEILFDDYPHQITWDIRRTKDNSLIVDQSATQGYKAGTYWSNYVRSKLFFDKCLPVGNYKFTIRDGYPYYSGSPSYFIASKDGKVIRRGGANGGKAVETVQISVTK
jgi:hypothetical protein